MKKLTLLVSTLTVLTCINGRAAEKERIAPSPGPCPNPVTLTYTISAPQVVNPTLSDFPAKCSNGWQTKFGQGGVDKCLRHTFHWKPAHPGCKNLSGTLTITYKANYSGPNYADNDTVAIYSNGTAVSGTTQHLYSGSSIVGQVKTKTIALTAAMLANNSLSFLVQDDTTVMSATLKIVECCLKVNPE